MPDDAVLEVRGPRLPRRLLIVSTALFFLAVGLLIATVTIHYTDTNTRVKPYAPLSYPGGDQHVDLKVIRNGQSLPVTTQRCSQSDKELTVRGSYQWTSVAPGGFVYRTDIVAGEIPPGCATVHFLNPMPPTVVAKNRELFKEGVAQVQWRLQGATFPVRPNGELGTPAMWQTQTFLVLP